MESDILAMSSSATLAVAKIEDKTITDMNDY
jgi:hypothetical protein